MADRLYHLLPSSSLIMKYAIFTSCTVLSFLLLNRFLPHEFEDKTHGTATGRFEGVRRVFSMNFFEELEREGASLAVYHNGNREVNLWGGFADSGAGRHWNHDTRTIMFSATKAISALCVAVLVDRGLVSYHDKVVDYWPEYGMNGKHETTIDDILTHKAGLPYLDEKIEIDDVGTENVARKLERAKPVWAPGTASGYHPVTFGFLLDEIFKRVDGRDLATFFKEEIADVHDLDVSIGVPLTDSHRSARLTQPGTLEYIRDVIRDPRLIGMLGIMYARFDDIIEKILATNAWIHFGYDMLTLNNPEVAALPLPSVTGSATADSAARLFSLLVEGQLVSNRTLSILHQPTLNNWHFERVVLYPVMKGHGFFYDPHPVVGGAYTFGHPGYGGQMIHVDPLNNLVVVYLSNGLKTGSGELCYTAQRILKEVYRSIL